MVFRFDGFDISAILFSNVFPDTQNTQAILLKGKKPDAEMEKLIFAIILQEEENGFSIWDEVVLPLPADYPESARMAEVTIGGDWIYATVSFHLETKEISITLENTALDHFKESYTFTPAPNILEL